MCAAWNLLGAQPLNCMQWGKLSWVNPDPRMKSQLMCHANVLSISIFNRWCIMTVFARWQFIETSCLTQIKTLNTELELETCSEQEEESCGAWMQIPNNVVFGDLEELMSQSLHICLLVISICSTSTALLLLAASPQSFLVSQVGSAQQEGGCTRVGDLGCFSMAH